MGDKTWGNGGHIDCFKMLSIYLKPPCQRDPKLGNLYNDDHCRGEIPEHFYHPKSLQTRLSNDNNINCQSNNSHKKQQNKRLSRWSESVTWKPMKVWAPPPQSLFLLSTISSPSPIDIFHCLSFSQKDIAKVGFCGDITFWHYIINQFSHSNGSGCLPTKIGLSSQLVKFKNLAQTKGR